MFRKRSATPPNPRLLWPVLVSFMVLAPPTQGFETKATSAFVIDQSTGTVLLSKNADVPLPPASMSKLMTLYVAFEALKDGRLRLDEKLPVSQYAMSLGGSTMFLDTTDRVSVEDLLRGIIVLSGNDACVVIAEALSPDGTEAGFARIMNERARQIGLKNTNLVNASGWPAPNHRMSMRDLATLADRLITDFPRYYPWFAEQEFGFDGRAPMNSRNRNPLLGLDIGADGLKTGHTQEAGYSLVGSATQGDRRTIFVIAGLESVRERAEEAEAIIGWSFRQFQAKTIAKAGTQFAEVDVWRGEFAKVNLIAASDVEALLPILSSDSLIGEVIYDNPIEAPISAGQEIGKLVFTAGNLPQVSVPLVADRSVGSGGILAQFIAAARILFRKVQTTAASAI